MHFAKNARVKRYNDKYVSRRSYRGASLITSPDSENERVSCCRRKNLALIKLISVVLHVKRMRAHVHNIIVANSILVIETPTSTGALYAGTSAHAYYHWLGFL